MGTYTVSPIGAQYEIREGRTKEMVDWSGIMGIPLLKKSRFTGSDGPLRYVLEKREDEREGAVLAVVFWMGEACSEATPEEEKTTRFFPFTKEGLNEAQGWLNSQKGKE